MLQQNLRLVSQLALCCQRSRRKGRTLCDQLATLPRIALLPTSLLTPHAPDQVNQWRRHVTTDSASNQTLKQSLRPV